MNQRRMPALLVFVILGVDSDERALSDSPGCCYASAYADDFSSLSARTRNYDDHPESVFSYCARNTAVYECLSYAADGSDSPEQTEVGLARNGVRLPAPGERHACCSPTTTWRPGRA